MRIWKCLSFQEKYLWLHLITLEYFWDISEILSVMLSNVVLWQHNLYIICILSHCTEKVQIYSPHQPELLTVTYNTEEPDGPGPICRGDPCTRLLVPVAHLRQTGLHSITSLSHSLTPGQADGTASHARRVSTLNSGIVNELAVCTWH